MAVLLLKFVVHVLPPDTVEPWSRASGAHGRARRAEGSPGLQVRVRPRFPRLPLAAAVVAALAMPGVARTATDPTSEAAVKAAFLYKFAQFTDWPPRAADAPLTVCIVGDSGVAAEFGEFARNRPIAGHPIDARAVAADAPMRACDVLFMSMSETRRAGAALEVLKSLPILTVSDDRQFAESGGVVALFIENGRMRFSINTDAADRAGLRLSSRLLSLAKIVKDAHAHP